MGYLFDRIRCGWMIDGKIGRNNIEGSRDLGLGGARNVGHMGFQLSAVYDSNTNNNTTSWNLLLLISFRSTRLQSKKRSHWETVWRFSQE